MAIFIAKFGYFAGLPTLQRRIRPDFGSEYGQLRPDEKKGVHYKGTLLFSAFYSIFITKLLAELLKTGKEYFFFGMKKNQFWSNF